MLYPEAYINRGSAACGVSGAEPPGARPVTYCFPPKNRTVLGDTLIVLVRKGHRQEEGALLCIVSHVILMDWKRNRFRTVTMRLALPVAGSVDASGGTQPFPRDWGTVPPNPAWDRTYHSR